MKIKYKDIQIYGQRWKCLAEFTLLMTIIQIDQFSLYTGLLEINPGFKAATPDRSKGRNSREGFS